ncbi:MAG: hypothetical protein U0354_11675 [Candidatus Sericytochromatia bacterium]
MSIVISFNITNIALAENNLNLSIDQNITSDSSNELEKIKKFMKDELGLENIDIQKEIDGNTNYYKITYENRTFLYEIDVFGALFSYIKKMIPENSFLEVYPQSNGKIISKLSLNFQDYLDFINKKISEDEFSTKVDVTLNPQYKIPNKYNPLQFHTDLSLNPAYILDATTGPTIVFAPVLQTFLDHGLNINTRYRLPIYNVVNGFDFTKNSSILAPSFGYTNLDYSSPILNLPFYGTARLGHIFENNAHNALLSTDLQYMILGGLVNLNLASAVSVNTLGKTDFSITPYGQFYIGKLDLVFEGGAGKFINGEYGGWGRLTRQFDNVDIGFSVTRGWGTPQSGFKLMFEFNIAIGPRHGLHAMPFRVTYPRFFAGNLVAGQFSGSILPRYKTEDFVKRLYPEYIKTHLYYWLRY